MGTLKKRGGIWYIIYQTGEKLPNGKYKQKWQSCPGMSHKEAQALLRDIESRRDRGEPVGVAEQTLETYLKEWLVFMEGKIERSTHVNYTQTVVAHIVPDLGKVHLGKLSPMQIERFYRKLQTDKHLSPKSVKNIAGVLHRALEQAMRWGLRATNPANMVDLPKVPRPEISTASQDQLRRLVQALESEPVWGLPIMVAIHTGMRRGEILALHWGDLVRNEDCVTLIVRRAVSQYAGSAFEKQTKSDRIRPVVISEQLAAALERHRARCGHADDEALMFTGRDSRLLSPKRFSEAFFRIRTALGIDCTLHGLRHTHVTDLLAAGVPDHIVAQRVGHSTVAFTKDRYAHVAPTMQQQAVKVIDDVLNSRADSD